VALSIAFLVGTFSVVNAVTELPPDTPVVVAEDVTRQADCLRSVNGGPEVSCPPGSVLYVRYTTYEEVLAKGIKHWKVMTKDTRQDADTVVDSLAAEFTPEVSTNSCSSSAKDIYQSYLYVPNVSNSTRIGFNLRYEGYADCLIRNIRDRNRVQSIGTSSEPMYTPSNVKWWYSSSGNGTSTRELWFGTSWTSFYQVPDSFHGREYRNISYAQSDCKIGEERCGHPYGRYEFD
jgi:hypothetical protein